MHRWMATTDVEADVPDFSSTPTGMETDYEDQEGLFVSEDSTLASTPNASSEISVSSESNSDNNKSGSYLTLYIKYI